MRKRDLKTQDKLNNGSSAKKNDNAGAFSSFPEITDQTIKNL